MSTQLTPDMPASFAVMISAAFEHVEVLQLQANFEVDERDKAAVEKLLSQMQKSRVYLSAWTRDAVASGMYRQVALFHEERAVEVSGGRKVPVSEDGSGSSVVSGSGRDAQVELSGEMGLTFSSECSSLLGGGGRGVVSDRAHVLSIVACLFAQSWLSCKSALYRDSSLATSTASRA